MRLLSTLHGIGMAGAALFALSATPAVAQDDPQEVHQLDDLTPTQREMVAECRAQAIREIDAEGLKDKPLNETNAMEYRPGEEFELHLAFLGHGNAFYTVTCQVDQEGTITFDDA
ncbi:MAG: hypothetical protein UMU75_02285, partial [Halomonas sp.]|nr:hypothetical protein [Halomonas sp.]